MKNIIFAITLSFCVATYMQAQVTYFGSNNYFLNLFTNTGFSSYDWRFEPLKTDLERGWLKGDVVKVVTTINDNASLRGSGTLFADTTYYNQQGNIIKIVAPILDNFFFDGKNLRPDTWLYEYNTNGKLTTYSKWHSSGTGQYSQEKHTMEQDGRSNIIREIYPDYVTWSWGYDTNGTLVSGTTHTIGGEVTHNLKYNNGQLISMSPIGLDKPGTVTYTYAPIGRMTSMKYFFVDGYDDEEWYIETIITLSYNDKGDIIQVVREEWNNTPKWVRKQQMGKCIYNITYTYDDKDNWTKAILSVKNNGTAVRESGSSPNAVTVTRAITYGQVSASTSPTTNDEVYDIAKKSLFLSEDERGDRFDPIEFGHSLITLDNYEQACLRANEASFPGNALKKTTFKGMRTLGGKEELYFSRISKSTFGIFDVHLGLKEGSEAEVCRDIESHGYKLIRKEQRTDTKGTLMTDHYYQHPDGKHYIYYITISSSNQNTAHSLIFQKRKFYFQKD